MEFFNKREDVIDLELTPYGEYLLSVGDFKPTQYAFFDDEILYDSKWAGVHLETQNNIKDRIKEVPRLKTQYLFTNTEFPSIADVWDPECPDFMPADCLGVCGGDATDDCPDDEPAELENLQPAYYLKQYALPLPLGNSSFNSDMAPAWDINLLYNNLDNSVAYFKDSMHPYLQIPQLDATIKYTTEGVITVSTTPETSENNINKVENLRIKEFDELHENPYLYNDGYFDFQEDFITLEINEHNVPYLKENFEIEVFEIIEEGSAKYDFEVKQKFFIRKPSVVNEKGLLKSEEETIKSNEKDIELKLLPLNNSFVERFFNIYVDYEIDKDLMCQLKPNVKQKGFFISDPLECFEDKEVNILSSDIYKDAIETIPECDF